MRILFGCLVLLTLASPASACVVMVRGLTFQQWLPYCHGQIIQFCGANRGCQQQFARAAYQTYQASQVPAFAGGCAAGASRCRNGWVDVCNRGQWMATGSRC